MKLRCLGLVGVALCALAIGGCGDDDPEVVTLSFVGETDAPRARDAVVAPGLDPRPSVALSRAVHWIEVTRCDSEFTDCSQRPKVGGYCGFDMAFITWETAMGEAPVPCPVDGTIPGFDDALRGPPAIVGPITIGERPANAGWDSLNEPLVEGEVYAISAYVYEPCDDLNPDCVHTKAEGCQFFTVENGVPVRLEPTTEAKDWSEVDLD